MGRASLEFTSVKAFLCWQHFYKPLTAICLIKIKGWYTSLHQILADVEGREKNECISSLLLKELFQHDISNKGRPLAKLKIRWSWFWETQALVPSSRLCLHRLPVQLRAASPPRPGSRLDLWVPQTDCHNDEMTSRERAVCLQILPDTSSN